MSDVVQELLHDARARLVGAPREILGLRRDPRRVLGLSRPPRILPVGEAWHLGVLLLTDDGLFSTGQIVRARREAVRGYTAESQRGRADLAAAAARGGIPEGRAVHLDWRPVVLDPLSDPLGGTAGTPSVRWSRGGSTMPLGAYLDERVDLLLHPPEGAS